MYLSKEDKVALKVSMWVLGIVALALYFMIDYTLICKTEYAYPIAMATLLMFACGATMGSMFTMLTFGREE